MSGGKDSKLRIEISQIPEEGLILERADTPCSYGLQETGLSPLEDVCLQGKIQKTPSGAYLGGRVSIVLELECGRCLRPFPFPVRSAIQVFFLPKHETSEEPKIELASEDLDVYYYDGTEIEILDPVRDQVVLSAPIQPLCEPDCPGLCHVCGAPLKQKRCACQPEEVIDPRLVALKKFIKKKE